MLEGSTGRALRHPGGHWRSLGGFWVVLVDTRGLWSGLSIHRRAVVLPGRTRSPGSVPMAPAGFGTKRGPLGGPWSTLESSVAPREGSKLKEVSPGGL